MLLNYAAPRIAPNIVTAPTSNIDTNAILGLTPSQYAGLQNVRDTGYFYGNNRMYEPYTVTYTPPTYWGMGGGSNRAEGTLEIDGQAFRPVDVDITGFSKSKADDSNIYTYDPSMAYVLSQTPRNVPKPTPNLMSFLSSPTPSVSYNGNYGAGRFLNTGNLLGFNFGTPSGQTTGGQATP